MSTLPASRPTARAVALLLAPRAALTLLLALPAATAAARFARGPAGDAPLFEPGALHLVDALRLGAPALGASTPAALVSVILGVAASLPLLGAAMHAMRAPRARAAELGRAAGAALAPFALLFAVWLVAAALAVGGTYFVHALLSREIERRLSPAAAELSPLAAGGVAAAALGALQIAHDLSRAAAIVEGRGALFAAWRALGVLYASPLRVAVAAGARAAVSAAALALALLAFARLGVATRGHALAVTAVDAAAMLALATARASWLAAALRLVESSRRAV